VDDTRLVWAIFAPMMAGLLSMLCWLLIWERSIPRKARPWLELGALAAVCGGLLVEGMLLILAGGRGSMLDMGLQLEPVSRAVLLAANVALLCAVFISWEELLHTSALLVPVPWVAWGASLASGLLAATLLLDDALVQVLCLFAVGLLVSALTLLQPRPELVEDDAARTVLALRVAGGLKHLALSAIGTGLLVVGALLVARYALRLENQALLQAGVAALAVGLAARAGLMPFSASFTDMLRTVPGVSTLALGAGLPTAVALGLLLFSPIEGGSIRASSVAWLGGIGALLAGLRALDQIRNPRSEIRNHLVAMTVALSLGWALFGVLSGSRSGAVGAGLLAINIAVSVPLLVASGEVRGASARLSAVGTAVGALSLLGVPPLGGTAGTLLLSQAAANLSGVWLAVLLLGSLLAAGAWLGWLARPQHAGEEGEAPARIQGPRDLLATPLLLLVCVLVLAQPVLFFASGPIADALAAWAVVPWTIGP
jgi:formate hydrogenlyase subunit 3/multisubunit Na+/H+ antiporter MnhD subunit